jgi:NADH-quinone oxidoreductase subunit G
MIKLTINDTPIAVPKGTTILEAARTLGDSHTDALPYGPSYGSVRCRKPGVFLPCLYGRSTRTSCAWSLLVLKRSLTGCMFQHIRHAPSQLAVCRWSSCSPTTLKIASLCPKNLECDLQKLAADLGVRDIKWEGERIRLRKGRVFSGALVKDPNKCVMCRRCETMCNEVQTCGILSAVNRGFQYFVGPAFNLDMKETSCTYCGQCVAVCPTSCGSD